MLADSSCFMLLTPLGFISSWLCVTGATQYYGNNDFWTGFGLIMLAGFLSMIYIFWIAITLRYHYNMFKEWQRAHTEVRLVLSDRQLTKTESGRSDDICFVPKISAHARQVSIDAEVVVINCEVVERNVVGPTCDRTRILNGNSLGQINISSM